ncbi:unnamed protein product [Rhizoctonia solani]|uniref:Jacalin-type lectin domain-containing protein n=1 Tax=Rhizoctonia solani TaxID=456999 RepID=A0A8H3GJ79_9AGAM|nr:unnamed protein product [Rhizoctonia solani]
MWLGGNLLAPTTTTVRTNMENARGRNRSSGRGRGWAQVLHQGGNNNVYPADWEEGSRDATAYSQIDQAAREAFVRVFSSRAYPYTPLPPYPGVSIGKLLDKGYLYGVRIDSNDGPRRSPLQVAQRTSTRPLRIREPNSIITEFVTTEDTRDTNYVHKGWSLAALSDKSPWTISRITRNNQVNNSSQSITKYVILQKLRVDLSTNDISPVPALEEAFKAALGQPTLYEKSRAVYQVFEHWGDMIPLVFDIGVSLAVTDLESVAKNYLTNRSYLGLEQLSMSGSARASTQGGDPTILQVGDNVRAWLGKSVPTHQWEQVWITKAVPLTAILNNQLRSELSELHQSLTTYCPTTTATITSDGTSFDGASHTFKTLSKIAIFSDGYHIKSLAVKYTTEPSPIKYGADLKANNEFELRTGEHVTDVIIWKDHKGVCGIQLNTSQGRTSKHFGSDNGSPTILRSPGGCLAGFSGVVQGDKIHDLQTIWRHDVQGPGLGGDRAFSQYYGGVAGTPFSDWPFITYEDIGPGGHGLTPQQANYHGGSSSGGKENSFELEANEQIVAVLGRFNKYIVQLCFVTNKGRTSEIFGGGDGEDFRCQAPKSSDGRATRLHYICGKSGDWLNGVLLVWAPL